MWFGLLKADNETLKAVEGYKWAKPKYGLKRGLPVRVGGQVSPKFYAGQKPMTERLEEVDAKSKPKPQTDRSLDLDLDVEPKNETNFPELDDLLKPEPEKFDIDTADLPELTQKPQETQETQKPEKFDITKPFTDESPTTDRKELEAQKQRDIKDREEKERQKDMSDLDSMSEEMLEGVKEKERFDEELRETEQELQEMDLEEGDTSSIQPAPITDKPTSPTNADPSYNPDETPEEDKLLQTLRGDNKLPPLERKRPQPKVETPMSTSKPPSPNEIQRLMRESMASPTEDKWKEELLAGKKGTTVNQAPTKTPKLGEKTTSKVKDAKPMFGPAMQPSKVDSKGNVKTQERDSHISDDISEFYTTDAKGRRIVDKKKLADWNKAQQEEEPEINVGQKLPTVPKSNVPTTLNQKIESKTGTIEDAAGMEEAPEKTIAQVREERNINRDLGGDTTDASETQLELQQIQADADKELDTKQKELEAAQNEIQRLMQQLDSLNQSTAQSEKTHQDQVKVLEEEVQELENRTAPTSLDTISVATS